MLELIDRKFIVSVALESAWEHLAMVEHWSSWATHICHIELVTGSPLGEKSKGVIYLKNGIETTFIMTEFNRHQNWKWVGPFLWLKVHYDHRFRAIDDRGCEVTFHVVAEGSLVGFVGRLFAMIYNRNLDVAIPNLIAELTPTTVT